MTYCKLHVHKRGAFKFFVDVNSTYEQQRNVNIYDKVGYYLINI